MAGTTVALVFGVLLAANVARAAPDQHGPQPLDAVAEAIRSYPGFTIFDDVGFHVDGGVVVLSGHVTMAHKRADIETRVRRVSGVRGVHNGVKVLPASRLDRDVRYRVALAIYGDPRFYRYASMASPPIRIVVEHGRVTLTGVVASEVERVLARSLASGHGARSVTCALRTDSEVRAVGDAVR
jgi:hyperosmotically inducible protein